jgi:hypothetical protein
LAHTTSLSWLWQQQGKRAEAHQLLAPVYGWFTEGFDTADLRDAKVLLDELQMEITDIMSVEGRYLDGQEKV